MKKKLWFVGIISMALVMGVTLIGCASTQNLGMYDPSIPETEQCVLEIAGGLHINTFDGKKAGPDGFMGEESLAGLGMDGYAANFQGNKGTATIKIPAGHHDLIAGFYIGNAQGHVKQSNLPISYDFAAGHTYRLKAILLMNKASIFSSEKNIQPVEDYKLGIDYERVESIKLEIEDKGVL
jgi:hypothetical protein